ncbi:MAG: hypothetical protein EA421_09980 [Gemmatimonadales bacterium]|nr:MAG: hypothetical protein EA421_09980 [Gemmatimonadales bacterium]
MKSLRERLSFRPTQVSRAVGRALILHPDSLTSGPPSIPQKSLQAVRRRLAEAQARGTTEALEELARGLVPMELNAVARGLLIWPEVADTAEAVLLARSSPRPCATLWQNLEGAPADRRSHRVLAKLVQAPRARWPGPKERETVTAWLAGETLEDGVMAWSRKERVTLVEELARKESPLSRDTRMVAHLAGAWLRKGKDEEILREPLPLRQKGWDYLSPEGRQEAGRNYLRSLSMGKWEEPFCVAIADSFGLPFSPESRREFWDPLSDFIRKAFHRRMIRKTLDEFFTDHERKDYWVNRWSEQMMEVKAGEAGTVRYAIMVFQRFGVVEFFETGNAAYFYDLDLTRRFMMVRPDSPGELKQRIRYPVDRLRGAPDNRLMHSQGWRERGDRRMQAWLKQGPK